MYSTEDKNWIKEVIQKNIIETQNTIIELENLTKPVAPSDKTGLLSRVDAINDKALNSVSLREMRKKLFQLQRALSSIEKLDFGKCTRCGKLIPFAQLIAAPESTCCVKCP